MRRTTIAAAAAAFLAGIALTLLTTSLSRPPTPVATVTHHSAATDHAPRRRWPPYERWPPLPREPPAWAAVASPWPPPPMTAAQRAGPVAATLQTITATIRSTSPQPRPAGDGWPNDYLTPLAGARTDWLPGAYANLPPPPLGADFCLSDWLPAASADAGDDLSWLPCACAGDAALWRRPIHAALGWWPGRSLDRVALGAHWRRYTATARATLAHIDARVTVSLADCTVRAQALRGGWNYLTRIPDTLFLLQDALTGLGCGLALPRAAGNASAPGNSTGADTSERVMSGAGPAEIELLLSADDTPHTPVRSVAGSGSPPPPPTLVAPIFGYATDADHATVPLPDFSFLRWSENGDPEVSAALYGELMYSLLHVAATLPYSHRRRQAVFRGQLHTPDRAAAVAAMRAPAAARLFDLGFVQIPVPGSSGDNLTISTTLSLLEFPAFAVQVYVAGTGYSARLKYLLATGSPVVALVGTQQGGMREWWGALLVPWVHFVPVYSAAMLPVAVQWLLDRPDEAARIGANGRALVEAHLTPHRRRCYTWLMLRAYAEKWRGDVAAGPPPPWPHHTPDAAVFEDGSASIVAPDTQVLAPAAASGDGSMDVLAAAYSAAVAAVEAAATRSGGGA